MEARPQNEAWLNSGERRRLMLCACAGFFLSPGAWLLQVIISETVSAQECYGVSAPRARPLFAHLHALLYGISAAAVLVSLVCAALATHGLLFIARKQKRIKAARENAGDQQKASRDEERVARMRFIAVCSSLIGWGFFIGLGFTILAEVFVTSCDPWH
ncbi:hypothetical protein [Paraburkholderia phenoliruptrix]|uniref:hypothetical protein n=1 Tax=Paraburkholderia phenoliruptrix TaxID=252970 RepID=UPI0001C01C59|nr:hypothetical protein [Paraburkholderia phenoliruptrix]WMY12203.1 hypothetical protein P3F88_22695 [Paraburkholderia phenoliruptrix]